MCPCFDQEMFNQSKKPFRAQFDLKLLVCKRHQDLNTLMIVIQAFKGPFERNICMRSWGTAYKKLMRRFLFIFNFLEIISLINGKDIIYLLE